MVRLGDQFSLKFNLKFTIFFPFFYRRRITSRAAKRSERGVPPKFTDFAPRGRAGPGGRLEGRRADFWCIFDRPRLRAAVMLPVSSERERAQL